MLWANLLTMPFGLTEPIFGPKYWSLPSLFNLARRTGFDQEGLIFFRDLLNSGYMQRAWTLSTIFGIMIFPVEELLIVFHLGCYSPVIINTSISINKKLIQNISDVNNCRLLYNILNNLYKILQTNHFLYNDLENYYLIFLKL